jgi:hypothetical protein
MVAAPRCWQKVDALHAAGPVPLSPDEIEARRNWYGKMLDRIARGDIEAHYRRAWMLTAALEDYFALRGMWYEGPKAALAWLKLQKSEIYDAFAGALETAAQLDELQKLINKVISLFD